MKRAPSILIALLALVLAACSPPPSDEEVVAQRSQARWDALVSNDFEGSYSFQSPAYRQETTQIEHIVGLSRRRITWISAEVIEADCEADRCEVTIRVGYRADGAPGALSGMEGERSVREIWIRLNGQWWYSESA